MYPEKISVRKGMTLFLKWNDGSESNIKIANLRRNCPCALCGAEREERGKKYIPIYNDAELKIKSINQVGSYAISIEWDDNHSTGIYDFSFLKQLTEKR